MAGNVLQLLRQQLEAQEQVLKAQTAAISLQHMLLQELGDQKQVQFSDTLEQREGTEEPRPHSEAVEDQLQMLLQELGGQKQVQKSDTLERSKGLKETGQPRVDGRDQDRRRAALGGSTRAWGWAGVGVHAGVFGVGVLGSGDEGQEMDAESEGSGGGKARGNDDQKKQNDDQTSQYPATREIDDDDEICTQRLRCPRMNILCSMCPSSLIDMIVPFNHQCQWHADLFDSMPEKGVKEVAMKFGERFIVLNTLLLVIGNQAIINLYRDVRTTLEVITLSTMVAHTIICFGSLVLHFEICTILTPISKCNIRVFCKANLPYFHVLGYLQPICVYGLGAVFGLLCAVAAQDPSSRQEELISESWARNIPLLAFACSFLIMTMLVIGFANVAARMAARTGVMSETKVVDAADMSPREAANVSYSLMRRARTVQLTQSSARTVQIKPSSVLPRLT